MAANTNDFSSYVFNSASFPWESEQSYLLIPSFGLHGFTNTDTYVQASDSGKPMFLMNGNINKLEISRTCPIFGGSMHVHGAYPTKLIHLPFAGDCTMLQFEAKRLRCPDCLHTEMQNITFKADNHRITIPLKHYIESLLACNKYTLKDIAEMTGVNKNIIKEIDKTRLVDLYTDKVNGKPVLKRIEESVPFLGVDEFLLHKGNTYATHIIDQQSGKILWIAEGKKKQVIYDFIDHYGLDWMQGVQAVACDMNSDFEEAFIEKCPHIKIVYDHFHLVKNFNDKVVSEVRKDEQKRLEEEGDKEGARSLKKSRFILTSSRETLRKKDKEAEEGKVVKRGSELFKTNDVKRKGGYEARYDSIIAANKLLFIADFVKEKLSYAYSLSHEEQMLKIINEIINVCEETENKHFLWFAKLLRRHRNGIITHATYKISAGKIEGINNRIKTLRRQSYGLPDDEYFFLKLIDRAAILQAR